MAQDALTVARMALPALTEDRAELVFKAHREETAAILSLRAPQSKILPVISFSIPPPALVEMGDREEQVETPAREAKAVAVRNSAAVVTAVKPGNPEKAETKVVKGATG
jgi:hypothetical protein